jgi:hypothetical protein
MLGGQSYGADLVNQALGGGGAPSGYGSVLPTSSADVSGGINGLTSTSDVLNGLPDAPLAAAENSDFTLSIPSDVVDTIGGYIKPATDWISALFA